MHGGTVTATSEGPGKGSEFVVRLPAAGRPGPRRPTVRRRPRETAAADDASRVLVVDDNVDTAKGMARLLKLSGHDVRVAHSGMEAIEAAREHRPEVVLLDIGLPGMDGYEVATRCGARTAARTPSSSPSRATARRRPAAVRGGGLRPPPGQARRLRRPALAPPTAGRPLARPGLPLRPSLFAVGGMS